MFEKRILAKPSERVLVTISPANYITHEDGKITVKNSPRMRLLIDNKLFEEQDLCCDRMVLKKFDEARMGLIFEMNDTGARAAPIENSGKLDFSLPMNHKTVKTFNPRCFPILRKAQCQYQFKDENLIVLLPVKRVI